MSEEEREFDYVVNREPETGHLDNPNYVRTYNKLPVGAVLRPTAYDGKMLRQVRLTQIPGWLMSNRGMNAFVRFDMFMDRYLTNRRGKMSTLYLILTFVALNGTGYYWKEIKYPKQDAEMLRKIKYTDEEWESMRPRDRKYIETRLFQEVSKSTLV